MPLETPSFWQTECAISRALAPLSFLYGIGHAIKTRLIRPYKSTLPVLCVGGVTAGGSGKTPVVHALLKILRDRELFVNPVILTRGYGGALNGPTLVDLARHDANDVGDEALLHARRAPTIVSRNRINGAKLAEAMGADLIILDDGLQNPALEKNLSFLVISDLGNARLIPAGPLREPVSEALNKCAALILTTDNAHGIRNAKPVVKALLQVTSAHDRTKTYFGFAGLGRPEKFETTLKEQGFNLRGFQPFADHHPYSSKDMEILFQKAGTATLITTEKDIVRVPLECRDKIDVLTIERTFDWPEILLNLMKAALSWKE